MRYANAYTSLAILGCVFAGCSKNPDTTKSEVPVVGMAVPVELFQDSILAKAKGKVEPGTTLTVLTTEDKAWQVRTQAGQEGWLRPCWICTSAEYDRRKAQNQLPEGVICLGSEGGQTFMYGGSVSIQGNQLGWKAGDVFWMDPTMKGQEFDFGREKVKGDPSVLLLKPENGNMIRLAVWTPPRK